jgi:hypothetical protein
MFEMTVDLKMIIRETYAGLEFDHFPGFIEDHRRSSKKAIGTPRNSKIMFKKNSDFRVPNIYDVAHLDHRKRFDSFQ